MPAHRLRPWIALGLIWAAYFHPLILHPTQTLFTEYSDFAAEHLPGRVFLVREWRTTGELPLWNPYHFCGAPFVHDIQVGAFYPPYAVSLLFHESCAGAVMSWVIALHVLAASAFAFLYARSHGMGEAGSLVAGIGFAYSAKWLTHLILAGHTITVGLAWLPLVLLALEAFIRSGRKSNLLGGGIAFALLILGTHPQWTFYSGLFVAAWTVPERSKLGRWALGGLGIVMLAVLLAAVQLLPTWEATQHSSRTVGLASQSLVVGIFSLFSAFGPSAAYDPPNTWELRSLLSLFGLAAAVVAPTLAPSLGRGKRSVLLALLVFSFGGAILVEWLPGFNLFRAASRMLVIAAFPVAFLAGASTDAISASAWDAAKLRVLGRAVFLVAILGGFTSIVLPLLLAQQPDSLPIWPEFGLYWAAVAAGLVAVGAACFAPNLSAKLRTGLWLAAMLVELIAPTFRFVDVKSQADMYPDSPLTKYLNANEEPASARAIDVEQGTRPLDRFAPLGIGSPQAFTQRIAMPRGYNPIDVRHYREFLNFTMGSDERVRSLEAVAQPIVPNFPRNVPSLWALLNVRHLVCFDDYVLNEAFRNDPGHRLEKDWRLVKQFETTPNVPALSPLRPDPLPRVLVWENLRFAESPRAFVVPNAAPMPAGRELQALMTTDLHKTVLVSSDAPSSGGKGAYRPVGIREYRPNRVAIDLAGGEGGWLVLADVWFPGWVCRIDGVDVPVHRANHAFRAVAIPAGAKEAVFRFEPESYRLGWWISAIATAFAACCIVIVRVRA